MIASSNLEYGAIRDLATSSAFAFLVTWLPNAGYSLADGSNEAEGRT